MMCQVPWLLEEHNTFVIKYIKYCYWKSYYLLAPGLHSKYTLIVLNKSNAQDKETKVSKNVSIENKANENFEC